MRKIVLASASPRRKEILRMTGLRFSVSESAFKEDLTLKRPPRELARFLSREKAASVAHKYRDALIIAADTFIAFKNRILGKPRNAKEAGQMLKLLSGQAHSVITGFTIMDTGSGAVLSRSVRTEVYFKKLSNQEISAYVTSKEPLDKAGAYAIQGLGAVFIEKIEGDFFNVVGLPLNALTECLKKFDVRVLQ